MQHIDAETTGVVARPAELAGLRHAAGGLELGRPRRVHTPLVGPYVSPFRGRGLDFDEVRAYQSGDDVRHIDWRVTARSGRVHSKVFHEERDRPLWLLLDAGPGMHFGTRTAFKSVAAARAAALLAWAALRAGDPLGAIARSAEGLAEIPAGGGQRHLMRVLASLARATEPAAERSTPALPEAAAATATPALPEAAAATAAPAMPEAAAATAAPAMPEAAAATAAPALPEAAAATAAPAMPEALRRLQRRVRSGSRVFVLSDFYDFDDSWRSPLSELGRRCDLTCVLVYDRLESEPPPPGRYRVSDGRDAIALATGGRRWREAWCERFEARQRALVDCCRSHRIELLPLRTDADSVESLAAAHHPRRAASARRTR